MGANGNYKTIQAAVNAASSGYMILVGNGMYREHLTINKKLTIKAMQGASPVVDGDGSGVVFSITASGVWLEGLTIRNKGTAGYGILVSSGGCTLINNILDGSNSAIKISGGTGNTVDDNTVSNATMGIFAYNTKNNVIRNNDLYKNVIGLRLYGATGNTVTGNYAHENAVGLQADDAGSKSNTIYLNDFLAIRSSRLMSRQPTPGHRRTN